MLLLKDIFPFIFSSILALTRYKGYISYCQMHRKSSKKISEKSNQEDTDLLGHKSPEKKKKINHSLISVMFHKMNQPLLLRCRFVGNTSPE